MKALILFAKKRLSIFAYFILMILYVSAYAQTASRPNFLWISSEDNSKHYLKMYESTGVQAPNIESLAENGLIFNNAFCNSAVCSAARSTLVSGVYGPSLASQYHRNIAKVNMPSGIQMWMNTWH